MQTYPLTGEGLATALEDLGKTANTVAEILSREALVGKPGDDCGCPVALYLQAVIEEHPRAGVYQEDHYFACVWRSDRPDNAELTVDLPDAVRDFVRAFDRGEYPDLIEGVPGGAA